MAIICDMCSEDVTNSGKNMLGVNGKKICCCVHCFEAVTEWATGDKAKEYCKQHRETSDSEMGG